MKRWAWPVVAALLVAAMTWYWKMALDDGPPQFTRPPGEESAAPPPDSGRAAPQPGAGEEDAAKTDP